MSLIRKWSLYLLMTACLSVSAFAETPSTPVQLELLSEKSSVNSGDSFWVSLHMHLDDSWHAYWKNPGDAGMAPSIEWTLPEGFTLGETIWSVPQKFINNEIVTFGYSEELDILTLIKAPSPLIDQEFVEIGAKVNWVVCSEDTCLPGESQTTLKLHLREAPIGHPVHAEKIQQLVAGAPQKLNAQAVFKSEFVHVTLEKSLIADGQTVSFIPETDSVDYHHAPLLNSEADSHILALKAGSEGASSVKGLLIVGDKSFELEAPITGTELALAQNDTLASLPGSFGQVSEEPFEPLLFAISLGLAFLGGMILNLMPCVLPVVSFKVMGFINMADQKRATIFKHGLVFTLGVLISFWVLAGALLLLKSYGHAVGWGFQLQEPLFVAILAGLFLVFGLNLFGVFELGTSVASAAGQAQIKTTAHQGAYLSSFLSGVFATAVATPCTGPFLGATVGYAVTLPALLGMIIFTFLGFGMAFPYLLIAAFPKLLRWMPKPGAWMEAFKQFMGFIMLTTVLWLVWVFGAETSEHAIFLLLQAMLVVSLGCWIYGKWGTPFKKKGIRLLSMALAASCLLFAASIVRMAINLPDQQSTIVSNHNDKLIWETFSKARVDELRAKNVPVLIDFTAKWCLICQANDMILNTQEVEKKLDELGVVRMKADWTKNDPAITQELKKFGRSGVPLYILYGADESDKPQILPQVLTTENVISSLELMNHAD